MSRSYRRAPVYGRTCKGHRWGEASDKRHAHHRLRSALRQTLRRGRWDAMPLLREVSDVWGMRKDGKRRLWGKRFGGREWWWVMGK